MMDAPQLYRMLVFASVVEHGSLTGAASALGISRSMVSQHLKRLEQRCQFSLLHRTTRSLALTQAGQEFYHYCAELLKLAQQAEMAIIPQDEQLQGSITLAAPVAIGEQALPPILKHFHRRYPQVHISLLLQDRQLNLLEHQIDIAIQTGRNEACEWMSMTLSNYDEYLVASPEYLAEHGAPLHADNLVHHPWIMHSPNKLPRSCQFNNSDGDCFKLQLTPFINCNTLPGTLRLVLEGMGIAMLPEHLAQPKIDSGRLVRLLPDYHLGRGDIYLVHPYPEVIPPRVKALIELISVDLYPDVTTT